MRAACRKFLNDVGDENGDIVRFGAHPGHYASWIFNGALGELRGVFGIHIARLAAHHGLDVEDELASILPAQDLDEDTHHKVMDIQPPKRIKNSVKSR